MHRLLFLFLSIFAFNNISSAQDTIYVNINAAPHGDGSSWDKALQSLWLACQYSEKKDMIWIAGGEYTMYLPELIERSVYFVLKDSISIYGGFRGNELSITDRNILENPTLLSGEIGDTSKIDDNVFSVMRPNTNVLMHKLILDGLIIVGGNANTFDSDYPDYEIDGGGLYLEMDEDIGGEIIINNCIFKNNAARFEGNDIYIKAQKNANITIRNCQFLGDVGGEYSGSVKIVGENLNIYSSVFHDKSYGLIVSGDSILIDNCLFSGNSFGSIIDANNTTVENSYFNNNYSGLLVYRRVLTSINVNIQDCKFNSNLVGLDLSYIYNGEGFLDIINSTFEYNDFGIAHHNLSDLLYAYESTIENKEPSSIGIPMTIKNSVFHHNTKRSIALYNRSSVINNCIFYNNRSQENGTVVNYYDTLSVYNSIFYDNSTLDGSKNIYSAHSIVENCLFDDGNCDDFQDLDYTLDFHYDSDLSYFDTIYQSSHICENNIFNSNPEFKDPGNNDFNLKICSPAINSGYNAIIETLHLANDYQGNPRIQGDAVDMGIYEYAYNEITFDTIIQNINETTQKGSLEIKDVSHGTAPYTYLWSTGSTENYIEDLEIGEYSLSITDADGCEFAYSFEISDVTATSNILSNIGISIYPNPIQNSQKVNINYKSTHAIKAKISFTDIAGRNVGFMELILQQGENRVDVPNGKGIYLMKIELEDGRVGFEKIMVY